MTEYSKENIRVITEKIGFRIKEIRQQKNITLNNLAVAIGVSTSSMYSIELHGTIKPSTIDALTKYLGIDVDQLVNPNDALALLAYHNRKHKDIELMLESPHHYMMANIAIRKACNSSKGGS